jgi:hypothetical protein
VGSCRGTFCLPSPELTRLLEEARPQRWGDTTCCAEYCCWPGRGRYPAALAQTRGDPGSGSIGWNWVLMVQTCESATWA